MDKLEQTLKAISDAIAAFKGDVSGMKEYFEATTKAQDERIGVIEKSIREKLISDYGPREIPKNQFSFLRFGMAYAQKDWSIAPFEKSEIDKYREKTAQAGNFTVGGALIPPQYIAELIELLVKNLVLTQLGVTTLTGLTGSPVIFPKITSGLTAYWISEGNAPTVSDMGTAQLHLQPRKLGALSKISNDLLLLNNPSMEAIVRADIVRAMNEAVETAAFEGTGTAGSPLGLLNWTPAITEAAYTTTDTGTKINSFKDMVKTVENANALRGNLGFAFNPTSYWAVQKLNDSQFRPLMQSDPALGNRPTLLGYPVVRGPLVSSVGSPTEDKDNVYFGNWSDYILAIWSAVDVSASFETNTAFQNDELWIRAFMRVDTAVRLEASFVRMDQVQ